MSGPLGANEFLDFNGCYMPKDLQDEFIGRWASTSSPSNDTISSSGSVKNGISRPRIAVQ